MTRYAVRMLKTNSGPQGLMSCSLECMLNLRKILKSLKVQIVYTRYRLEVEEPHKPHSEKTLSREKKIATMFQTRYISSRC
uniref:Putative ovule protein n=1 Tax=Solanum chacoense TaxID=4108 RepID=A0A0V0HZ50_SOLCH